MKKLPDFINRALAAAGINTGAAAFAATFLFVVAVLVFADHTNTAALILLAMLTVPILFNRSTPTPFEIASVAGAAESIAEDEFPTGVCFFAVITMDTEVIGIIKTSPVP